MSELLSVRWTILKAHDGKHCCYVFRTAAKGCTCWKSCWLLIIAGSSHVLHSELLHHRHGNPAKPRVTLCATNTGCCQESAANHLPSSAPRKILPQYPTDTSRLLQGSSVFPTACAKKCSPSKLSELCPG